MGNYTPSQLAIGAVIALGVCAIIWIAAGAMGVPIPTWIVNIIIVCIVVVIAAAAIRFISSA